VFDAIELQQNAKRLNVGPRLSRSFSEAQSPAEIAPERQMLKRLLWLAEPINALVQPSIRIN
jgi:hypothetical protein